MASSTFFEKLKRIIGGVRSDSPPTTVDGEPSSLRLNSVSELFVTTHATEYDSTPTTWINTSNTGAGDSNWPDDDGYPLGRRDHLTLTLILADCTAIIEITLDGVEWFDITPSCLCLTTGTYLEEYDAVGTTGRFVVDLERVNVTAIRCNVTYPDASNSTQIKSLLRKA